MAGAWRGGGSGAYRDSSLSVNVKGLAALQATFRRIGGELPRNTRKALREIAEPLRDKAKGNIQHKTGRHGDPNLPHLADSIKISTARGGLAVYSNEVYAVIQDQGGRVGHGGLVTRASASHYMTKAVQESTPLIEASLTHLADKIANEFEGG